MQALLRLEQLAKYQTMMGIMVLHNLIYSVDDELGDDGSHGLRGGRGGASL